MRAEPFDLSDARLLDGPFRHAQEMDRRYLLSLDPDRLLACFRLTAGLPPRAQPYGGWEAPDGCNRGHFEGHYLSACAKMYAATGDGRLKRRALYMVAEMAECQRKLGGGYVSAFPTDWTGLCVPWYVLHKLLAGLLDVYRYCGDAQALEVARGLGNWIENRVAPLNEAQMQEMLGTEHGGINEGLANLYAATGERRFLALALRFNHHAVIDPLSGHQDKLTGLHANTQIPKLIGCAREYELTGDESLRAAAAYFWHVVAEERSYVIGGHSDCEHFSPTEHLSKYLSESTTETCNTYNMLKLTRHLFEWDPEARYADFYERALYNHILASQDPDTGMMSYYVPLKSGARRSYCTPTDSFWCCTGTGIENHAQYGDSIYFHDADGLYVNLFIASELTWRARGMTIRQETRFPEQPATRLTFACARPTRMTLRIRHPFWCVKGFRVRVNGRTIPASAPQTWAAVTRVWRTGDAVDVALPIAVRTEAFRDDPNRLAFLAGPIVLCAPMREGEPTPVLVTSAEDPARTVRPAQGAALQFVDSRLLTVGQHDRTPVTLTPFYKATHTRCAVYWDRLTPSGWIEKQKAMEQEMERRRNFVDVVDPGDSLSEKAHGMQGENSRSGAWLDRHWRDAAGGGWFSFDVRVLPDQPMELTCTYWGSDSGGREFDILVDGVKIGSEALENRRPNEFFDRTYAIPPELTHGKSHVVIRLQAHPGKMAGGVFGIAMARR
jgi:DUF1680 family protein